MSQTDEEVSEVKRWFRRRAEGGTEHAAVVAHRVRSLTSFTVASDDPQDIRRRLNGGRSQLAGLATNEGPRA